MTPPPRRSVIVWFSQRVGSTVFAQALEDTGVAGKPREWLNAPDVDALFDKHGVTSARALKEALWREGTSSNGVLGLKYGMHAHHHAALTRIMAGPGSADPSAYERDAWNRFFPDAQHVFITRRNRIRLAVSWWRAIKSNRWHRLRPPEGPTTMQASGTTVPESSTSEELIDAYDYDAIDHLLAESAFREAAIQAVFERWSVVPYTVVYEDLFARWEPSVRQTLEFLGLHDPSMKIPGPAHERIADEVSEAWVKRFRTERQARWNHPAW